MGRASDVILIANKAESMINHLLDDEDWLNVSLLFQIHMFSCGGVLLPFHRIKTYSLLAKLID